MQDNFLYLSAEYKSSALGLRLLPILTGGRRSLLLRGAGLLLRRLRGIRGLRDGTRWRGDGRRRLNGS
jgi:hypothetical protein